MMRHVPQIRIFLSSPGDLDFERKFIADILQRLFGRPAFRDKITYRLVAWDKVDSGTVMIASMSPQEAINAGLPRPSECDIVICMFWSRMGTPFEIDGVKYLSGTHYELLDALNSKRPKTLIYRRTEKKYFEANDTIGQEQFNRVQEFFNSDLFYDPITHQMLRGVNHYSAIEEFEKKVEMHVEELVVRLLERIVNPIGPEGEGDTLPFRAEPEPYHLVDRFVGRKTELKELDSWATSKSKVLVIKAMGGMGKSALLWEWINQPQHAHDLLKPRGIFWFSFYEKGATLDGFIRYALAYVTNRSYEEIKDLRYSVAAQQLMKELRETPYLLALDGMERILLAYKERVDSAHIRDENIDESPVRRECPEPEDNDFLWQIANCGLSKIIISTRLLPRAFEPEDILLDSVQVYELSGFQPEDAHTFLVQKGIKKADHEILDNFIAQFGYHPLMLRVIAGSVVKQSRGNFDDWYEREGRGMPLGELDEYGKVTEILNQSLGNLPRERKLVLAIVGIFSEAVHSDVLDDLNPYLPSRPPLKDLPPIPPLFVNPRGSRRLAQLRRQKIYDLTPEEKEVHLSTIRDIEEQESIERNYTIDNYSHLKRARDQVIQQRRRRLNDYKRDPNYKTAQRKFNKDLRDLRDRGVLQYNDNGEVFDLHPLVRAYVTDEQNGIGKDLVKEARQRVIGELESKPLKADVPLYRLVDEYHHYIMDKQWERAASFFNKRLEDPLFKEGKHYEIIRFLTPFFSELHNEYPPLQNPKDQAKIIHAFAVALEFTGQFEKAANFFSKKLSIALEFNDADDLIVSLIRYARVLRETNALGDAKRALSFAQDAADRYAEPYRRYETYGESFRLACMTGAWDDAEAALLKITQFENQQDANFLKNASLERARILLGQVQMKTWQNEDATNLLEELMKLVGSTYFIYASGMKYRAIQLFEHGEMTTALEHTNAAIAKARSASMPIAGLQAMRAVILQRLSRPKDAQNAARDALESIAASGIVDQSDAYLNLAQYSLNVNDKSKSITYARKAYELAWCDGTPNSYWWGLKRSGELLEQIGENKPILQVRQSYSIPYEPKIRAFIEELLPRKGLDPIRETFVIKEFRWFELGVIANFDTKTDEDKSKMANLCRELYALTDDPGPALATTSDELVDPYPSEISYLEDCVQQKIPEELDLKFLRQAEQRHDTIAIAYVVAAKPDNELVYLYVSLRSEFIVSFYEKGFSGDEFSISDFGRVVHKGSYPVTDDERDMMFDSWLFCEYFLPIKLIARKSGGD